MSLQHRCPAGPGAVPDLTNLNDADTQRRHRRPVPPRPVAARLGGGSLCVWPRFVAQRAPPTQIRVAAWRTSRTVLWALEPVLATQAIIDAGVTDRRGAALSGAQGQTGQ